MEFSQRLKKYRKENGLSQEGFSEQLDVTRQSVSKWELGKSYPEVKKLIQLSELLDISVHELIMDKSEAAKSEPVDAADEEENEDFDELLIIGGFIIGTSIGFFTGNDMIGIVGGLIGLGVGLVIKAFFIAKNNDKVK